jgi:protein TonB
MQGAGYFQANMTGPQNLQSGDRTATLRDAAQSGSGNVVAFGQPRGHAPESRTAPLILRPEDRRAQSAASGTMTHAFFIAGSLVAHGLLFVALFSTPIPLTSVGVEVITVEIVIGGTTAAGLDSAPSQNEVQAAAALQEPKPDETPAEPQQAADQRETDVAKTEEPKPEETEPPRETQNPVAMVETPQPTEATVPRQETPPEFFAASKPAVQQPPKQDQPVTERPKQQEAAAASASSSASSGIGRGRSDNDTNYRGMVAAHLARHKQYPASARGAGTQGVGTITFTIDGRGGVTSASVVRGTGASILDAELQAMVRRASPFPAPPGGRAMTFSVPVAFRLQ